MRESLLEDKAGLAVREPAERLRICDRIETHARGRGEAIALVFEGQHISYGQLAREASRLALSLRARGASPESLIGLSVERSPELVVGMLAILKAGCVYLPLDPSYPSDRLAYMIEDSEVERVLVDGAEVAGLPESKRIEMGTLALDEAPAAVAGSAFRDLGSGDLAYVIYTSGSTGRPKGALVEHRGLLNLAVEQAAVLGVAQGDQVLQFSPLSFDASIFEIVMALASGATLHLARQETLLPGPDLLALLGGSRITHLTVPPSVLAALPWAELPNLRVLCCAGEPLPESLAQRWASGRRLFNLYGPTETTIWATGAEVAPGSGPPSIGAAIDGVEITRVDERLERVSGSVPGEITIGGVGVGRGYLRRPGLTAERFVPDPFSGEPGARLYLTGDLATQNAEGHLDFVGRADFQVKVRGHRIELGEIEGSLDQHPELRAVAVVATDEAPPRLMAFVVPRSLPGPATAELASFARERLPDYMVPAVFGVLDELPRTPSGKTDRQALLSLDTPSVVMTGDVLPDAETFLADTDPEYQPPATPTEEALAEIWAELLGVETLGRDAHFFELGGHSLLVGRLIARIRDELGVELGLRRLFEAPTLAELARHLDAEREAASTPLHPAYDPPPREGDLPLSFPQERIWFFEQLVPGNLAYNAQAILTFRGALDRAVLARALTEIIRRHEILRTTFVVRGGRPVQEIQEPFEMRPPLFDLSALRPERRAVAEEAAIRAVVRRPYDVSRLPLVRWCLVHRAPGEHALIHVEHHFIHDGWSFGVLVGELEKLYEAIAEGRDPRSALAPPSAQFADFALWQRQWMRGETLRGYLEHWGRLLEGMPSALDLPTDRPRPESQTFAGAAHRVALPPALAGRLRGLARKQGTTLFNVMLAGFAVLLHRYSGASDFGLGSAIANRRQKALEGMLGMVVNTLVLRCDLRGQPTFRELLDRFRDTTLDAQAYQDIPFDKLVEELQPERDPSRNPLFQVLFSFHDSPVPDLDFAGLEGSVRELHNGSAKTDLNIIVIPRGEQRVGLEARAVDDEITVIWEFNTDLFDAITTQRMIGHYWTLLASATDGAQTPIAGLPLLPPSERHQLLGEWNDTAVPASPLEGTLHGLFEASVRSNPEAIAVIADGRGHTYGELEAAANRLARAMRRQGVLRGALVGVHLPRSVDMTIAVLAALKAGGAYVPLDASWPAERVRGIVDRTEVAHLLTSRDLFARLVESSSAPLGISHAVCLDVAPEAVPAGLTVASPADVSVLPDGPLTPVSGADDFAYLIFTSGSTGIPKGVIEQHRPAVRLIDWVNRSHGVDHSDRLLFVTSLSFDLSVYDLFGIFAAGGTVRVASREEVLDPRLLAEILCQEPITFWDSAPTALQQLVSYLPAPDELESPPALRRVFLSGDWIPLPLPDQICAVFAQARVVALGGATEATVWSNFFPVGRVGAGWPSIPYGRPIEGARYHVLDPRLEPCPVGIPGDLYIGGACLSVGYARDPRLTAAKYLPDSYGARGGRLYRTGDRARYLPDGNLQFLGRLDTQVKLRGFRIELGEIESLLSEHSGVREAVVLVDESGQDRRLAAFYTSADGESAEVGELREFLRRRLPEYMVPAAYSPVESWPHTATGKLDRKALLASLARCRALRDGADARISRGGDLRDAVARVWCEALELDATEAGQLDVDTSFFDLGGHSLLMPGIHARLREELGFELPLVELFRHPTIRGLAALLGEDSEVEVALSRRPARDRPRGGALAVIGFAGRFPSARNPEELWRHLGDGRELVRTLSDDELLSAGVPQHELDDPRYVKRRASLEDPELFDAAFFAMTPREAQLLDPQQRLFLECAWQALEHAGYCPDHLEERVGVFAGAGENTYAEHLRADPKLLSAVGRSQIALANNADYLATRVSYKLDLKGPSLNVQTACSTSLVAVHLARLSLLAGDCEMALAGGVSVRAREVTGYLYEEGGIGSPDGRVRAFDALARGTVGGSGAGCVVLKPLEDALAAGDTIHAVLRSTAINNDGAHKVGFTAPSVAGQAAAIREAHRTADVEARTIGYVEAHGTGTSLGDPIEFRALEEAFASGEPASGEGRCALGSVKTNLGHLDAAAGAAGLIKTILALDRRMIPPSLHFRRPNPEIELEDSGFEIPTEPTPWRQGRSGAPRRAGVSSFGLGGTNAHAVLEEAPVVENDPSLRERELLILSARSPAALEVATTELVSYLEGSERPLADVAYTLGVGRRAHTYRRAVLCGDHHEGVTALRALEPAKVWTGRARGKGAPGVAFLLPGQGSQHPAMAAGLVQTEPEFRGVLEECLELLRQGSDLDLRELLGVEAEPGAEVADAAARLDDTRVAQPALFAVEYALARLWMHRGLRPAALLGHSLGELVAACLAGVMSLADALRAVVARGRLMGRCEVGSMLALTLGERAARERIEGRPLALAAINAPASCVVSGPSDALEALAMELREEGLGARHLHTSHAFHSPSMDEAVEPFVALLREIELSPPEIPFLSNVTGTWISASEATAPAYWGRQLRGTVRFMAGCGELLRAGHPLLEVGPGRALATLARQHPRRADAPVIAHSLPPASAAGEIEDRGHLMATSGRLWAAGLDLDWSAVYGDEPRRRVPLPTYPFERRRFWFDGFEEEGSTDQDDTVPVEIVPVEDAPREAGSEVAKSRPKNPIEETISQIWRDLLGIESPPTNEDFFELGGSSLTALQMTTRLRQEVGLELSSSALLEAPTIAGLAEAVRALSAGSGSEAPSCLVRLQPRGERRPFFLVHPVGGAVTWFRDLARELAPDRPLLALRSRGLESGEAPLLAISEMAACYLESVRSEQPRGPYLLGGSSMGGSIAFEMARQLELEGEEVALLTLFDSPCLDQLPPRPDEAEMISWAFEDRPPLTLDELRQVPLDKQLELALDLAAVATKNGSGAYPSAEQVNRHLAVVRANVEALYAYRPEPLCCPILFLRAGERRENGVQHPERPWIGLAGGGIEIQPVPGGHVSMNYAPYVETLARRLRRGLERAEIGSRDS